ncbi:hypothetical protein GCM10012287_53840 [Streptomyces daqingensis]|uniref:Uncharacterized protein n=1 Tax=Streptomyces daqingensis TaxID=1472640 RepID=A0ABQ2MTM6_9ACTN|nr:hypothetical protein GCM10012287_53840 [Streptomyces daqingensis]
MAASSTGCAGRGLPPPPLVRRRPRLPPRPGPPAYVRIRSQEAGDGLPRHAPHSVLTQPGQWCRASSLRIVPLFTYGSSTVRETALLWAGLQYDTRELMTCGL